MVGWCEQWGHLMTHVMVYSYTLLWFLATMVYSYTYYGLYSLPSTRPFGLLTNLTLTPGCRCLSCAETCGGMWRSSPCTCRRCALGAWCMASGDAQNWGEMFKWNFTETINRLVRKKMPDPEKTKTRPCQKACNKSKYEHSLNEHVQMYIYNHI